MDLLTEIYYFIYAFLRSNPVIALVTGVAAAIFLWKKPWEFLKFLFWIFVIIAIIYIASTIGSSMQFGATKKHEITTEREEHLSTGEK